MQIVTAQSNEKGARVFTCEKDFGETVADSVRLFTEAICKDKLDSQLKVDIQGVIRRMLKAGKPDEEILTEVESWMPSIRKPGKSTAEKMDTLWDKLPEEEKKNMLRKWKQKKV